jgi:fatty acid-binding protein DegV
MLDIKPVFRFHRGDVVPVARPRTRKRALDRIVQDTMAAIAARPVHLAVIHAAAPNDAQAILERLSADARVVEQVVVPVTPVIGAHTGPGLVGTAFYCD